MELQIRHTKTYDFDTLHQLYVDARSFMKRNGNPNQWRDYWPDDQIIQEDIDQGRSYVVVDGSKILAVFAYIEGTDQTYLNIRDGSWLSNKQYGTIHRLASSMEVNDIFSFIIAWIDENRHINLRADTHKDNIPMQKQLLKNGFVYCGIIKCIEGGDRLAYERVIK